MHMHGVCAMRVMQSITACLHIIPGLQCCSLFLRKAYGWSLAGKLFATRVRHCVGGALVLLCHTMRVRAMAAQRH